MNKTRQLILLIGIVLTLGAIATWDEWQTKKEDAQKSEAAILVKFDAAAIDRIEFTNNGNEPTDIPLYLSARRDNQVWTIEKPVLTGADTKAVENLIGTLKDYKYDKVVAENTDDKAKFGLEKPRRRLMLYSKDKLLADVSVGANSPVGYHTYLAVEGDKKIYLGSQYLAVATHKNLFDLRDKAILQTKIEDINSFTAKTFASNPFTIESKEGKYAIVGESSIEADATTVRNFVEDLGRASVTEIIDIAPPDLAKAIDTATESFFKWQSKDGQGGELLMVAVGPDIYIKNRNKGLIYKVSADFRKKFSQKSSDFRNKRLFTFSSSKIVKIEIDGKSYERTGEEWKNTDPASSSDTAATKIRGLVVDLEYARAIDFLSENFAAVTKDAPAHRIKLFFDETSADPQINKDKSDTKLNDLTIDFWTEPAMAAADGSKSEPTWILKHSRNPQIYRVAGNLLESILNHGVGDASGAGESPLPTGAEGDARQKMDIALPESVDEIAN